jgi:hypothetical protein
VLHIARLGRSEVLNGIGFVATLSDKKLDMDQYLARSEALVKKLTSEVKTSSLDLLSKSIFLR